MSSKGEDSFVYPTGYSGCVGRKGKGCKNRRARLAETKRATITQENCRPKPLNACFVSAIKHGSGCFPSKIVSRPHLRRLRQSFLKGTRRGQKRLIQPLQSCPERRGSGYVLNLCHVANVGVERSGLARSVTADRRHGLDRGRGQGPLTKIKTEAAADLPVGGQAFFVGP